MNRAHHFIYRTLAPLLFAGLWVPPLSARPEGFAAPCTGCHYAEAAGGGSTPSPSVTAVAASSRVEPGEQVDITVMVDSAWPEARVAGFLLMSDSEAGLFTPLEEGTGNVGTDPGVGLDYAIGHTAARELQAGVATFRATWTAPTAIGTYDFDVFAVTSDDGDGMDDPDVSEERNDSVGYFQLNVGVGCDLTSYYQDRDVDGYGGEERLACEQPPGYVLQGGDCADDEPAQHPGAVELCSFRDEDCDGEPMAPLPFYGDADGDGYGEVTKLVVDSCIQPAGFAAEFGDCAPNDPNIHPGAIEVAANGVDDNCDGTIDESGVPDEPGVPEPGVPDEPGATPGTMPTTAPTTTPTTTMPTTSPSGGAAPVATQMNAGGSAATGCGIARRRGSGLGLGLALALVFGGYLRRCRAARTQKRPSTVYSLSLRSRSGWCPCSQRHHQSH